MLSSLVHRHRYIFRHHASICNFTKRCYSSTSSCRIKVNWTELKPSPDPTHGVPIARSSHGVSTIYNSSTNNANKIVSVYIYGGENVARTPLEDSQSTWRASQVSVTENDPERTIKWSWTLVKPEETPPTRVRHAQCAAGSSIYIFGGRS